MIVIDICLRQIEITASLTALKDEYQTSSFTSLFILFLSFGTHNQVFRLNLAIWNGL